MGQLVIRGLMKPMTLKALWFICSSAHDQLTASVSRQDFRENLCQYIAPKCCMVITGLPVVSVNDLPACKVIETFASALPQIAQLACDIGSDL